MILLNGCIAMLGCHLLSYKAFMGKLRELVSKSFWICGQMDHYKAGSIKRKVCY